MQNRWTLPGILFGAITAAGAAIATLATRRSVDTRWYRRLKKAPFQPPQKAFGPVWTGLYGTIAASGAMIYRAPSSPARTRALALWGSQLALNAGWSVLFFGARRPRASLYEIGALLGSIVGFGVAAWKVDRRASLLMAPYAAWTTLATALNAEIVRRNPRVA